MPHSHFTEAYNHRMNGEIFETVYILGLIYATVIRSRFGMQFRRNNVLQQKKENLLVLVGMAIWGMVLFLPLFYIFTSWLDFANYQIPAPLGVLGCIIFIGGLYVLHRSHIDLASNFSPSLFIQKQHTLVTHGIYKHIRHPMYLSFWAWAVGQALLIPNWIAGPLGIAAFYLIYTFRIEQEEQQLIECFGDAYTDYKQSTGRLFPKLK